MFRNKMFDKQMEQGCYLTSLLFPDSFEEPFCENHIDNYIIQPKTQAPEKDVSANQVYWSQSNFLFNLIT